jgi:hypothetical protein
MDEFRIDYTITRRRAGEADFTEIGFGSSGTWSDVDQAVHIVSSEVQSRSWETSSDMPDPGEADHG